MLTVAAIFAVGYTQGEGRGRLVWLALDRLMGDHVVEEQMRIQAIIR